MKKTLTIIFAFSWYWLTACMVYTQDTTPKGPAQWTPRNWLGFCIQIGLFVLVIIGIYKLAIPAQKLKDKDVKDR